MAKKTKRINVEKYRELISKKRKDSLEELSTIRKSFCQCLQDSRQSGDLADECGNNNPTLRMPERKMLNLKEILRRCDEAEQRIREGTYGICQGCERPIPENRLDIMPFAIHCTPCASIVK